MLYIIIFLSTVVVIIGTQNTFRGFLVQARSTASDTLIGTFIVSGTAIQQTLDCDNLFPVSTTSDTA